MPQSPLISTRILITAKDINGNNVQKTFNAVLSMACDYYKGTINIVDNVQGSFFFGLTAATVFTTAIAGNTYLITIS